MTLLYQFHFILFGLIAVVSAILFVTRKSPVAGVLWLVQTFAALAAMYVMLEAHFVAAIQVLVYAGAIMVVFLFVIMLLNLGHVKIASDIRDMRWRLSAGAIGLLLLAELFVLMRDRLPQVLPDPVGMDPLVQPNVITPLAQVLFRDYLLAFQVAGVLLLVAVVGAAVLAKRVSPRT
ncbi:MAG TPA: NADH-quinone oxidoreductase subunit J [Gemmatimonadales bacterium]|nr:NADH-quinone oxidoreductase subunit J [Gemmatimonadales bacterium]